MLSVPHIIVIFIVALVVFGPEKLPELARNLGKVMAEFRRHTSDLRSTFEGHLRDLEREADSRKIAGPQPVRSVPSPAAHPSTAAESIAPVPNPAPGTVPSDPPNAAAIDAGRSNAAAAASDSASSSNPAPRKYPGDDPFLRELAENEFGPAASEHHEPSEPERVSERVSDGDIRPA